MILAKDQSSKNGAISFTPLISCPAGPVGQERYRQAGMTDAEALTSI